jgi:hypothetical protein
MNGHHDVPVMDDAGKVLASKRVDENAAGVTTLVTMLAGHARCRLREWVALAGTWRVTVDTLCRESSLPRPAREYQ